MRIKLIVIATMLTFAAAMASTPAERILKLRDSTSITITPTGKDPMTVFGRAKVRPLVNMFNVDAAAKSEVGGKTLYKIAFYRTEDKPFDVLWVKRGGIWGFDDLPGGFGKNPDIIRWLEKTLKG
jgi:hypothetical protein